MKVQPLRLQRGDALIMVDVQSDFLPGGALGVPKGDEVIAPLNRSVDMFSTRQLPVFATRDWHPPDHCSFRAQGGPWPPHCIAGSPGAAFAATLSLPSTVRIVSKATCSSADAYSGFEGTDLAEQLRALGRIRVFLGGLATDYCVRATALDARAADFDVIVLQDAVRAVDVEPGDGMRALHEIVSHGVRLASAADLVL
jgi:nicotinamidase/pyrazinamidase